MHLFSIAGIRIVIDYSWFIIFILATWSISGVFQQQLPPGTSAMVLWSLSGLASALLFVSVLLHELSHSLVARLKGLEVPRITLFLFGGVSELSREPDRPGDEFLIAIVGPLASFAIAGFCLAGVLLNSAVGLPLAGELLTYLTMINFALGVFNLVPAFPLDGGRVLRAWLWAGKGSYTKATVSAARVGKGLAFLLMGLGITLALVTGNPVSLWWVLIGLFVSRAANASVRRAVLRQSLSGTPVGRIMSRPVLSLPPGITLDQAVQDTLLNHTYAAYPVTENGMVLGILTLKDVKKFPRTDWPMRTVAQAMTPLTATQTLGPDEDVVDVLERMFHGGRGRMPVTEDGFLVGMLTRRDIMDFLRVRTDLGTDEDRPRTGH